MAHYHRLFLLKHREKGNDNKLPLPFFAITPQKKMIAHCRHFLFLKHKVDKTHKKTTKKNQKKGGSSPLSSCFALSLLVHASALSLLPFCFKRFLLTAIFALLLLPSRFKL